MGRQRFEVEYLGSCVGQRLQQAALAAAGGAAHHAIAELRRQTGEFGHHMPPISLVTAVELHRCEADFLQDMRHRPAAAAAAPAIHQRTVRFWFAGEPGFQMLCDVARHQRGADFFRLERRHLFV